MSAAPELREQVGPYRVLRAIGSGGTARIDLARIDRAYNFQRHVVLKRPLEHLRGDPAATSSLRREARLGGRLQHPHLVAMLDAGEHDGYDYLVLEYVHGCSLRTLMQTDAPDGVRRVPLAVALGIAIDIARGLHHAHELRDEQGGPLGLVHRDVSPGNVLLGLDGAVKLADFGIAKETRVATLSGSMHGTVTYMAPEQCRGHAFDRRADIWALGVILWELVAHTRLFWADNDVASLHKVLSGNIARPRHHEATLSKELEDIVMTAVSSDPERRFASARDLADALEALASREGHVIGARWVARTVEEVAGARPSPWIAATTLPGRSGGPPPAPRPPTPGREASLVAVIEALAPEPPPALAFGPTDALLREEGSVPTAPSLRPRRPRRLLAGTLIAGTAFAAGGLIALQLAHKESPAGAPPTTVSAPTVTTPPPPPPSPSPLPPTVTAPDPVPVTATTSPSPSPSRPPRHRHHDRAPTPQPPPPSPPSPPPPPPTTATVEKPPPPPPSASVTPAPNVEWKPSMLLPTDSGSGKSRSSGH